MLLCRVGLSGVSLWLFVVTRGVVLFDLLNNHGMAVDNSPPPHAILRSKRCHRALIGGRLQRDLRITYGVTHTYMTQGVSYA